MRISTAHIVNFRALRDFTIDFSNITSIIGPNGAGKSSILYALEWFFNGGKTSPLSSDDASFGHADEAIEVTVTFTDLTSADRSRLGKYTPEAAKSFTARKIHRPDNSESFSANALGYPPFTPIKAATNATERKSLYQTLRNESPSLGLPTASTATKVLEAIQEWEANNPEQLTPIPDELSTEFFGFNSKSVMGGLFDYVLVSADLRASEESDDTKGSIIARLLERSINRAEVDDDVAKIVERSADELDSIYSSAFGSQLSEIDRRMNTTISRYSYGRRVNFSAKSLEIRAPRTAFQLSVTDGDTITNVSRQGHGFQRTLLLTALQVLAESKDASESGEIFLAIEEPELYQHPVQAKAFAHVLRELAENLDQHIQVCYATHSPYFMEPARIGEVRRCDQSSARHETEVFTCTVQDVIASAAGTIPEEQIHRQFTQVLQKKLAAAIFSRALVLVEGSSDRAIIEGYAQRSTHRPLDTLGISVVEANGKNDVALLYCISRTLRIPTLAVVDWDRGLADRMKSKNKNTKQIDAAVNNNATENAALLSIFGCKESDTRIGASSDVQLSAFDDCLETTLSNEWPEWVVALEAALERNPRLEKSAELYSELVRNMAGNGSPTLDALLSRILQLV